MTKCGKFSWQGNYGRIDYPQIEVGVEESQNAFVFGIINKGNFEYIKPSTGRVNHREFPYNEKKSDTASMLAYELSKQGNCLIFCSKPSYTKSIGKSLLEFIKINEWIDNEILVHFESSEDIESFFLAKKWLGEESIITKCLKRGIGIHYGSMPQSVRKSIEKDFKQGLLRILVSTSTLGQGLNLPIKNLIIHTMEINPQQNERVKVRDFWNIVGRAGRAGKETEGQIIFITKSNRDERLFNYYTDINRLENVESLLFLLLKELIEERITSNEFIEGLEYYSEPFILNMLLEEIVDSEEKTIVEELLNNSLVKVQAINNEIDIIPIKNGFRKIFTKIYDEVPQENLRKAFAKTGFCLKSNQIINKYIEENIENFKPIVGNDDYFSLMDFILDLFNDSSIREICLDDKLKDFYEIDNQDKIEFITSWLKGMDIEQLKTVWNGFVNNNLKNYFSDFIENSFYYKYPWGITAFLIILSCQLDIDFEDLPTNIKKLPTYVKFGLNDEIATLSMALGINNREVAKIITQKYSGEINFRDFIMWFSNINMEDISDWEINKFDKENIINVALKLNTSQYKTQLPQQFTFIIKGIFYKEERKIGSLLVDIGDKLSYKREPQNKYDPFAIALYYKTTMLGYVPRNYAKLISTEVDLNGTNYNVELTNKEYNYNNYYYDLKVLMERI